MGKTTKVQRIEITMEDIWKHTRPLVQKSKKSYTRKTKHKNKKND